MFEPVLAGIGGIYGVTDMSLLSGIRHWEPFQSRLIRRRQPDSCASRFKSFRFVFSRTFLNHALGSTR